MIGGWAWEGITLWVTDGHLLMVSSYESWLSHYFIAMKRHHD